MAWVMVVPTIFSEMDGRELRVFPAVFSQGLIDLVSVQSFAAVSLCLGTDRHW